MDDWQEVIVNRTLRCAGDFPGVQLQFLLQRLEGHPEAIPAIADAVRDMSEWYHASADELDAEVAKRDGRT